MVHPTFSWAIRRYDGVVLMRGTEEFTATREAQCAG